jgi:hypothetical protein
MQAVKPVVEGGGQRLSHTTRTSTTVLRSLTYAESVVEV